MEWGGIGDGIRLGLVFWRERPVVVMSARGNDSDHSPRETRKVNIGVQTKGGGTRVKEEDGDRDDRQSTVKQEELADLARIHMIQIGG